RNILPVPRRNERWLRQRRMGRRSPRFKRQGWNVWVFLCRCDAMAGGRDALPHLAAIVPGMTSSDYYDGWSYEGGAWSLAFEESWPISTIALVNARRTGDQSSVAKILEAAGKIAQTYNHLPLADYPWLSPGVPTVAGYFYGWLAHDTWDDYWQQWSIRKRYGRVQIPVLNVGGWYDVFLNGSIENFVGMRKEGGSDAARSAQRLVIGPYIHFPW